MTRLSESSLDVLKRSATHAAELLRLEVVVLFGSTARGVTTLDSDIDLLLVLPDAAVTNQPLFALLEYSKVMRRSLREDGIAQTVDCIPTSLTSYQTGGSEINRIAAEEGIVLFEKNTVQQKPSTFFKATINNMGKS